jgi:signal transduction histidine kinase
MQSLIAERTISLLALRLADRVRNPAAVIGWTGKRLLKQADVPQAWKEHLGTIIEEVENLEGIVKEFQSLLTHKEPVYAYDDLNSVVRGVLSVIGKETDRKHLRLAESLFAAPLTMNMQRDTMRMAVFIILRNAVESSPEGGVVAVVTSEEDEKVMLSVTDSGAGIPKRMQERLFDPFYSARMERYGIGWPLVKQIVYEHMGTVEIESEKGEGSRFTVIFPKRWIDSVVRAPGTKDTVRGI